MYELPAILIGNFECHEHLFFLPAYGEETFTFIIISKKRYKFIKSKKKNIKKNKEMK